MSEIVRVEHIENFIYTIRAQHVMLDEDLSRLYTVETKALNQAVRIKLSRKLDEPQNFYYSFTHDLRPSLRPRLQQPPPQRRQQHPRHQPQSKTPQIIHHARPVRERKHKNPVPKTGPENQVMISLWKGIPNIPSVKRAVFGRLPA